MPFETPRPMIVRDAHEADLPAIRRIYAHHVAHGFGSFEEVPPDEIDIARRFAAHRAAGLPYLAAEAAGSVCGYAYAAPFRPRSAYRHTLEDSVYVDPAMTGRGIGRALLQRLIDLCTDRGYRQMVAVIGDSLNHASIGLHAALGFERAGTLRAVGFKHGRWVDVVMMQRGLGEAAETLPALRRRAENGAAP
jgi:phosphinothricin acetyltransferase